MTRQRDIESSRRWGSYPPVVSRWTIARSQYDQVEIHLGGGAIPAFANKNTYGGILGSTDNPQLESSDRLAQDSEVGHSVKLKSETQRWSRFGSQPHPVGEAGLSSAPAAIESPQPIGTPLRVCACIASIKHVANLEGKPPHALCIATIFSILRMYLGGFFP